MLSSIKLEVSVAYTLQFYAQRPIQFTKRLKFNKLSGLTSRRTKNTGTQDSNKLMNHDFNTPRSIQTANQSN